MNRLLCTGWFVLGVASGNLIARTETAANTIVGSHVEALAEREIVLAHYRLVQIAAHRRHLIASLRSRANQRLDEQRANARLIRERFRDLAALSPRPGG